jgi:hypothetical protein
VFIDFLVEKMPALLDAARLDCQDCAKATADVPGTRPARAAASG